MDCAPPHDPGPRHCSLSGCAAGDEAAVGVAGDFQRITVPKDQGGDLAFVLVTVVFADAKDSRGGAGQRGQGRVRRQGVGHNVAGGLGQLASVVGGAGGVRKLHPDSVQPRRFLKVTW